VYRALRLATLDLVRRESGRGAERRVAYPVDFQALVDRSHGTNFDALVRKARKQAHGVDLATETGGFWFTKR